MVNPLAINRVCKYDYQVGYVLVDIPKQHFFQILELQEVCCTLQGEGVRGSMPYNDLDDLIDRETVELWPEANAVKFLF